eukprot:gene3731-biopygen5729
MPKSSFPESLLYAVRDHDGDLHAARAGFGAEHGAGLLERVAGVRPPAGSNHAVSEMKRSPREVAVYLLSSYSGALGDPGVCVPKSTHREFDGLPVARRVSARARLLQSRQSREESL